jgi:hypothetical protein
MSELEADAVALDPADGTMEAGAFAQLQLDDVPQPWSEAATDHCAAARQIHDLNVVGSVLVNYSSSFAAEAMAIAAAMIAPPRFRARNLHAVERIAVAFAKRILVGHDQCGFDPVKDRRPEAVTRSLDTHEATNS